MLRIHPIFGRFGLTLLILGLTGCQLFTPKSKTAQWMLAHKASLCTTTTNHTCPPSFEIQGKIGLRSSAQTGSVFYTWIQDGYRYDIVLSGILGIGQTHIWGDERGATIENHEQHQSASSPEALLYNLTGWQAPLSLLPYWINGLPSPTSNHNSALERDVQQRLIWLHEQNWHIQFFYVDNQLRPNRLILETMQNPPPKVANPTLLAAEPIRLIVTIKPISNSF